MSDRDLRPSVLTVDDERGPRESLRMILEPSHRVLQAGCGSDALEILRTRAVDVVTLDLQMPGMRGDELICAVRREFPGVEVIVITGCGSAASAAEAVRQGICDYLQKPFDVVQVTAAVTRAVARRTARARLLRFLEDLGAVLGRDREVAVAELRRWAGVQFDPEIAKEFLACLEAGLCDIDPQLLADAVGAAAPRAA